MSARDGDPRPISWAFTPAEYTYSKTANDRRIDNTPPRPVLDRLEFLHTHLVVLLLDGIARDFGLAPAATLVINSGYRCPQVNALVKGQPDSQHMKGEALDCEVFGVSNADFGEWVAQNILEYDQLGFEFCKADDPRAGWIHLSLRDLPGRNRRMRFTIPRGR